MPALAALSALAVVLTLIEFPGLYREVVDREAGALALVLVRDLALVGVVGAATWSLGERARGSARSPWPSRRRRPRSAPR